MGWFIPWWAWVIVAGVLGIAELHTPGAYLIWIALGAAVTAAADAAWGFTFEQQLLCFAVASAVSCAIGFFVYRNLGIGRGRHAEPPLNNRDRAMIGARGMATTAFVNGTGKVRLGDVIWIADGPNLPEGAPIVVTDARNGRLVVTASPE